MGSPLSDEDRRLLVERNVGYVRALAAEIVRTLPSETDLDDLVAYGSTGLVEASRRYDPARGAAFTTFAYYRIRGAIFDGLRKMSWFGRRGAAGLRFQASANELLRDAADRDAGARAERAGEPRPGDDLASLDETFRDLAIVFVASLERLEGAAPEEEPHGELDRGRLHAALDSLPEREREVVRLHYFEDLSLEEIGTRIGLSRSWVSRMHTRAVRRLRAKLGA